MKNCSLNTWASSVIFKKMLKVNNCQISEKSSNLVTLSPIHSDNLKLTQFWGQYYDFRKYFRRKNLEKNVGDFDSRYLQQFMRKKSFNFEFEGNRHFRKNN
jgi:hypothetical protein